MPVCALLLDIRLGSALPGADRLGRSVFPLYHESRWMDRTVGQIRVCAAGQDTLVSELNNGEHDEIRADRNVRNDLVHRLVILWAREGFECGV